MMKAHNPPYDGGEPTYEYELPFSRVKPNHEELVTEWFERMRGKSSSDITQILAHDWRSVSGASFKTFTSRLLSMPPRSLVIDHNRIWLALQGPEDEHDVIMFHEPRQLNQEEQSFVQQFPHSELMNFCSHFHDTYEYFTPYQNGLWMSSYPASNDSMGKLGDWEHGMYLYYICSGDGMVMNREGVVGRWSHEIGWGDAPGYDRDVAVEPIAENFSEFINIYLQYLQISREEKRDTPFW